MGFLIDTCIWVDVERGILSPADVETITKQDPVFISPIVLAELNFGVEMSRDDSMRIKRFAALERLRKKPCLNIDPHTGEIFGHLCASLKKAGKDHKYRIQDLWLASQAIQHQYKLVTHNEKDFKDIPGLDLVIL